MHVPVVFLLLLGLVKCHDRFEWQNCEVDPLINITDLQLYPNTLNIRTGQVALALKGRVRRIRFYKNIQFDIRVSRKLPGEGYVDVDCLEYLGCDHRVRCTPQWMARKVEEDFFGLGPAFRNLTDRMPSYTNGCYFYPMDLVIRRHIFRLPIIARQSAPNTPTTYLMKLQAWDRDSDDQIACLLLYVRLTKG